ncbi:MAG: tetratricopeptide repeat protein [bacterium]
MRRTGSFRTNSWSGYLLILAALVMSVGLWGCKQKIPQSELDKFLEHYRSLPTAEFVDSLQVLANGKPPVATYAHYELGNFYYGAASDSAENTGWNTDIVSTYLDSAQIHFAQAIALDSTFVQAYVNLGSLYDDRAAPIGTNFEQRRVRQEHLDTARTMYERALAIDPDNEKANCNLGSLHLKQKEQTEAKVRFSHVLAINPNSALAHYNMAIMFAEEKIYREALLEWELAAKVDPDGDIGDRSRANIQIVQELLSSEVPENLGQPAGGH